MKRSSPLGLAHFLPIHGIFTSGDSDDEDEDRENLIGDIEDSGSIFFLYSFVGVTRPGWRPGPSIQPWTYLYHAITVCCRSNADPDPAF
jgi:hypothetical protein